MRTLYEEVLYQELRFRLAQTYYPDRSAVRLFREELVQTRGLKEALEGIGYKPYRKVLTRGQVKVIVQYLGGACLCLESVTTCNGLLPSSTSFF